MAAVPIPEEPSDLRMMSMLRDFQFTSPEQEQQFQRGLHTTAKRVVIKHALLGVWYVMGFSTLALRTGLDPAAAIFLVVPAMVLLSILVLCRWWATLRLYTSYIEGTVCLLGFGPQVLMMHFCTAPNARALAIAPVVGRAASSEMVWPCLFSGGLHLLLLTSPVYDKMALAAHLAFPLTFIPTMALSPNLVFLPFPAVCSGILVAASMWYKVGHTFAVRRLYLAQRMAHKASEVRMMEAAREADSVLNHSLKNCMADAWGLITLFLEDTARPVSLLSQASARLQWGMKWSKQRSLLTRLTAGKYVPTLTPVRLQTFMGALVQGRSVRLAPFSEEEEVLVDEPVYALVLENALSNATRHGHASNPDVCLSAELRPMCQGHAQPVRELVFRVTNSADPNKPPITEEFVARSLQGGGPHRAAPSGVSEGLGLQHIFMAARAVGLRVSLVQSGGLVTFSASAPVRPADRETAASPARAPPPAGALPDGLTFCCIDDSVVARMIVTNHLEGGCPGCTVRQYGERHEDVPAFVQAVLAGADVAILDQNLSYGTHNILGTELVVQLVAAGYPGLLCIRSANSSEDDLALYWAAGARCFIDKDLGPQEMVQRIAEAYWAHAAAAPDGLPSSGSTGRLEAISLDPMEQHGGGGDCPPSASAPPAPRRSNLMQPPSSEVMTWDVARQSSEEASPVCGYRCPVPKR